MKKRNKKLQLNRETLRNLSGDELEKVGGAAWTNCGSLDCSQGCPVTGPRTFCFCPFTISVAPADC